MKTFKTPASTTVDLYASNVDTKLTRIVVSETLSAGFPSPALDFAQKTIDLNKELVANPVATYYGRVKGDSMKNAGIDSGDLLVIDKSVEARSGKIAVCYIDGEFTVKRIKLENNICWLIPANENYQPVKITEEHDFHIWGVVTHVIKSF